MELSPTSGCTTVGVLLGLERCSHIHLQLGAGCFSSMCCIFVFMNETRSICLDHILFFSTVRLRSGLSFDASARLPAIFALIINVFLGSFSSCVLASRTAPLLLSPAWPLASGHVLDSLLLVTIKHISPHGSQIFSALLHALGHTCVSCFNRDLLTSPPNVVRIPAL